MTNLFTVEKKITANKDISPRFAKNFVSDIANIKSNIYFVVEDNGINAKSILGIISINIKNGNKFNVVVCNPLSQEEADDDMNKVIELLLGEKK